MAKKHILALPVVDEKGYFQTPNDVKIGDTLFFAGSWLKLESQTKSGLTWLVRGKWSKKSSAAKVRSSIFMA